MTVASIDPRLVLFLSTLSSCVDVPAWVISSPTRNNASFSNSTSFLHKVRAICRGIAEDTEFILRTYGILILINSLHGGAAFSKSIAFKNNTLGEIFVSMTTKAEESNMFEIISDKYIRFYY